MPDKVKLLPCERGYELANWLSGWLQDKTEDFSPATHKQFRAIVEHLHATRAIEATRPTDEVVERVARATCNIPPQGWWCSREAGHDGPCAARPMALDQARWFAMNIVDVGPERPSRAKWSSLRSLGQQVLRRLEMLGKLPSTGPTPSGHEPDCEWHCEQYPWECTCGLTAAAMKDAASD